jgi:hypothetical protein
VHSLGSLGLLLGMCWPSILPIDGEPTVVVVGMSVYLLAFVFMLSTEFPVGF